MVFGAVWSIYCLVRFVIIGFLNTNNGDEQHNKTKGDKESMCEGQKETKETKRETKKEAKFWSVAFGAENWKQKVVWLVAIVVYVILYQPFLSHYSKIIRIGLAVVFGGIVGLLTAVFGEKKPKDEQNNKQIGGSNR